MLPLIMRMSDPTIAGDLFSALIWSKCYFTVSVSLWFESIIFYYLASFVGIYVHYIYLYLLSAVQLLIVNSANQISFFPL